MSNNEHNCDKHKGGMIGKPHNFYHCVLITIIMILITLLKRSWCIWKRVLSLAKSDNGNEYIVYTKKRIIKGRVRANLLFAHMKGYYELISRVWLVFAGNEFVIL